MKNLFIYYFLILFPIPILYGVAKWENTEVFIALLVFYLIYRTFTDYYRLLKKGCIKKKDYFMFLNPFWRSKFFKELYFKT